MKEKKINGFKAFLERKDIKFSAKRYGIDALGAMAQGLFASLLIGTIKSKEDLSILYTPGVAAPCKEIAKDKETVYTYTTDRTGNQRLTELVTKV